MSWQQVIVTLMLIYQALRIYTLKDRLRMERRATEIERAEAEKYMKLMWGYKEDLASLYAKGRVKDE